MSKAVFFDRDDTLIRDVPYNGDPALVELMPGAQKLCLELAKLGYLLIIISNQSGVGRGYITEQQVHKVNNRVLKIIGEKLFTDVYCCFDMPDAPVAGCRKPSSKMILQASKDYNIDLSKSFLVGDKLSDVRAAKRAGCVAIYYNSRSNAADLILAASEADFVINNLLDALLSFDASN
jgi:D-glycero-D-manno-heptose 1,7-bisphosphate phosphatase